MFTFAAELPLLIEFLVALKTFYTSLYLNYKRNQRTVSCNCCQQQDQVDMQTLLKFTMW